MNLFHEAKKVLDKDGKVNPLGPYGRQKLTGREISTYFRRNPVKDANLKKAVQVALDLGGADSIARKEIAKFYGSKILKSKEVQTALQYANESVQEEGNLVENYRKLAQYGMGTETSKSARVGLEMDFYDEKGNKQFGKILQKTNTGYLVKDDKGKKHVFKYHDRKKAKDMSPLQTLLSRFSRTSSLVWWKYHTDVAVDLGALRTIVEHRSGRGHGPQVAV